MNRPQPPAVPVTPPGLPGLLLAYAGGLGCATFLFPSPLFAVAAALFAILWICLRTQRLGRGCLAACFWLLGVTFYFQALQSPAGREDLRSFISDRPLIVRGTALRVSRLPGGGSQIDLDVRQVGSGGIAAAVRGRMRLHIENGDPPVVPGDELRFRSRLRQPHAFSTPGEFDYPRHLAAQGIFVSSYLDSARDLAVIPPAEKVFRPARWQSATGRAIDAAVKPDIAPLVRALVTGDKGGISPEQRDLLARGGLSHLFSISGLHLGLIALFLYLLARFLYCRREALLLWAPPRRLLPLLLLPALWLYLQFTGCALPTRRAFLMALAGALLLFFSRRTQPLRLLATAALLILFASPLALFEPSFQLSFAGVLGILLVVPHWTARLSAIPRPCRWPAALALTTLAATLATAPLALLHFHLLAPAGLVSNLLAVPAIGFLTVPLGLAGAIASPWWPGGAALLFQGCAGIIRVILAVAGWLTAFPPLAGWTIYPTPVQMAAAFLLAAGLLLLAGSRHGRGAGGGLAVAGMILFLLPASAPEGLTVTALSVGQGEAILLSTAGRHYLVDGGGLTGSSFDVGERLVAPALGRLGVRRLEAVILSHDHPDHRLGLLHVLAHLPVGTFWTAAAPEKLDSELQEVLKRRKIPIRVFPPGWTVVDEESACQGLSLFAPPQQPENLNDSSLVVRAACGRDAVLLTGDLERSGIADLLTAMPGKSVTLLKLPHHGSRGSQPQRLFDRFRPLAVFASVGFGNPYHFPHEEVVAAAAARHIPLYRTDREGTLRFRSMGEGWDARHWERGLFR